MLVILEILNESSKNSKEITWSSRDLQSFILENNVSFKIGKYRNYLISLDFLERNKLGVKNKGSISIIGEYSNDKPSFKFIFEKKNEISNLNIDLIMKIYETANRPSKINQLKKFSFNESKKQKSMRYGNSNFVN
jgi:hypothetical protein